MKARPRLRRRGAVRGRCGKGGLLAFLLGLVAAAAVFDRWVERTDLPATLVETSTEVRDRAGALLRAYPVADGIWRFDLRSDAVDPTYVALLLAYEDKRFWHHSGIDLRALLRAGTQMVREGGVVSGGSTLTMQVARLLEDGPTGRWGGKLRQMRLALAMERRLSKSEILDLYLMHAPFGGNLEGVRAASLAWFGKEPTRLTESEAALLVALPQAPEARRPDRSVSSRAAARAARDRVLRRGLAAGVLSAETAAQAMQVPVAGRRRDFPLLAPHLADRLRREDLSRRRHDTTIDAELQGRLQALVETRLRRSGRQLSAAVIVADHRSGEILAEIGSGAYGDERRRGYVDMSVAKRSPGSTLKPLVYGLAFAEGLAHPETVILDGPVSYGGYAPQNFDGVFRGEIRLRDALRLSLNTPVVQLTEALGPQRLMVALRQAGLAPEMAGGQAGLAVALGGVGVSLRELVQLYAVIASGGEGWRLRERAENEGARTPRVLDPVSAWYVGDILRDVPRPVGAAGAGIAFKTGTSYGYRDAWALGWDGAHVIGVWMGRADGTPVPGAFGAEVAAPLLFDAFAVLKPQPEPLSAPPRSALLLATAQLPPPLRRFGGGPEATEQEGLRVLFPPDGAELALDQRRMTLKVSGGRPPFSVLADGRPVAQGLRSRAFEVVPPGPGYVSFAVIDAAGQSAQVDLLLQGASLVEGEGEDKG